MKESIEKLKTRIASLERKLRRAEREHEKTKTALAEMAFWDSTTGLYSRRTFSFMADYSIEHALRFESAVSLLLIDVDHFQTINDQHGRAFGDQVLDVVAQAVRDHIRKMDLACRLDADTIAVLMPETDIKLARFAAQRIQAALAQHPIPAKSLNVTVTVSVGVAELPEQGAVSLVALFKRAERALKIAKRNGGNRVVV